MKSPIPSRFERRAFALVVTVSLLVLLSVIALGFLSLSAVSLRSGSQDQAMMEARANARLALQIAIGELQKQAGPDQRITANGDMIDPNPAATGPGNDARHRHWMGVWNSWKAGDGTSFHRSVEGESLIGMAPTYQPGRMDYFRAWLLSLNPDEATTITSARDLVLDGVSMPAADDTALRLVGEGTLGKNGDAADYVSVRLLDVKPSSSSSGFRGRYGWWVGDESQKARIMGDTYATAADLTLAEKIGRVQAPGSTGTKRVKGLENLESGIDAKLGALSSRNTLDVLPGARDVAANGGTVRASQWNFHHTSPFTNSIVADVREGGLKRDLSALLEQKIEPFDVGDTTPVDWKEFCLYHFKTKDNWAASVQATRPPPQETVPIQDLAAYYQLYDSVSPEAAAVDSFRSSSKRGVRYAADPSLGGTNGIHLLSTDYGTTSFSPIYPREYSSIYRQPRIIKFQMLASLFSKRISPPIPADRNNPNPNTHELLVGITPAITFWNPTNLPVIFQMNSNPALGAQMLRFDDTPIQIRFNKNSGQKITNYMGIAALTVRGGFGSGGDICNLYWAGIHPIRLEPGEIKTLSLPFSGDLSNLKSLYGYNGHWNQAGNMQNFFFKTDTWFVGHEVKVGWEPESFIYCNSSAAPNDAGPTPPPTATDTRHVVNGRLRFKASDRIQIDVGSGGNSGIGWMNNSSSYQDFTAAWVNWDRFNGAIGMRAGAGTAFYQPLFRKGMTNGQASLLSPSRSGSSIIARSATETGWPFLHFGFFAGVETNEASNAGFAGGRKFASRPFLHSSPLHSYPFLDNSTGNDIYTYGWNWAVDLLNDVYEAPVQVTANGSSYWGGGYTPESGTTHVIQQEIPVVPPLSIAALSHARLGGWSISDQMEMPYAEMGTTNSIRRRNMTRAIGFGGLRPHTLQAIGNSYAHPLLRPEQTHTTVSRTYNVADGAFNETFADHSYLANKALWDEYFFSSITPQRYEVEVFESSDREAKAVAEDFFFKDKTLPNRRIKPYTANMDQSVLDGLFTEKDEFIDGLADKIAAHLMVEGAFNINSTSVEAWKIFFSSLKGKPVMYFDRTAAMNGNDPALATGHTGTPVGQVGLAGGPTYSGSPDSPRNPEQWTGWRELTDTEIQELAVAMVKQVKLRGPFLSLSEFVNRRLDSSKPELSVKGALQAALDDPDVSINKAFRTSERKFSNAELASMSPAFPLAAEGPVAYGSSAYIDQADILRGFAEQLTPRGDTFVIRTYGDSIDASGKVLARAWCEAVVQRLPDYVDPLDPNNPSDTGDAPEKKQADLSSAANIAYGRKLQLVSFRWLDASEI